MRNLIAVSVVMLVMASSAFGEPESKGVPSDLTAYLRGLQTSIILTELTGESKIEAQADRAIVAISIKTENSSLETALKSNQEIRDTIVTQLIGAGVSADDINAEKFSSTPGYGSFTDKPAKYKARTFVKITATDEDDLQEIAKIIDSHSEVEFLGINFEYSKEIELKKQAIDQAFDDLLKKKAEHEKKLNTVLTLRSFSEQTTLLPPIQSHNQDKKISSGKASLQSSETSKSEESVEKSSPPFSILVYTASVCGRFELR